MGGEVMVNPLRCVLAASAAFAVVSPAIAEDAFPSRTIRIVIPFPPGGPPDLMARLVLPKLSESWGKPVIVDNRAGATGTIGTSAVAKAPPDGHVVLLTPNQPIVIAPALFQTPYDPTRDLVAVATLGESTNALVVGASSPINSIGELIAAAKAKPGALSFSSSGQGSIGHLTGEMIKQLAGIDMLHVPYPGAAQSVSAVVSGEVSLSGSSIQQSLPLIKAGRLKALGVTGSRPSRYLPELKPVAELGLPGMAITVWYAAYVPAKTPPQTMQLMRQTLLAAFQEANVQQKLDAAGIEWLWQEPEQISARIATELALWRRVVQAGHITAH
jgi:tripartite-type tricarboxylate transporter receptor subunit TctC